MANVATLRVLLRVRRQALDAARQELAASIAAGMDAAARHRESEAAIRREHDVAASLEATDAAVEAFAAWLPRGREAVAAAEAALQSAQGATAHSRARLAAARAGVETTERLLEAHVAAERAEQARQLHLTLSEIGSARVSGLASGTD